MEIISALQNSAVHRLRNTWGVSKYYFYILKIKLLPPEAWDMYDKYCALFDAKGNFQAYRDTLKVAVPPCIPYLGMFACLLVYKT